MARKRLILAVPERINRPRGAWREIEVEVEVERECYLCETFESDFAALRFGGQSLWMHECSCGMLCCNRCLAMYGDHCPGCGH